jgi:hypothetical protein
MHLISFFYWGGLTDAPSCSLCRWYGNPVLSPGFEPHWERYFPLSSRKAPWHTKPHVPWVLSPFLVVKRPGTSPSSAKVMSVWICTPSPPSVASWRLYGDCYLDCSNGVVTLELLGRGWTGELLTVEAVATHRQYFVCCRNIPSGCRCQYTPRNLNLVKTCVTLTPSSGHAVPTAAAYIVSLASKLCGHYCSY